MGKMAEIDYENQQTDKDGTEGVVDLKKKMKPKKKELMNVTKKPKTKEETKPSALSLTQVNKTLTERVELNATRIDTLSEGMDNMKSLLDRVASRLGLE